MSAPPNVKASLTAATAEASQYDSGIAVPVVSDINSPADVTPATGLQSPASAGRPPLSQLDQTSPIEIRSCHSR
ncbi:MAG: hypothetical protein MZV63_52270 [Marinilabiliales bacterium]|nr:hypothetical protein [Marinilabiliales bacterium]